jgi:adenylate kinase
LNLVLFRTAGGGQGHAGGKFFRKSAGWPQLSTGEMLRAAIAPERSLGAESQGDLGQGRSGLRRDRDRIIAERYDQPDCAKGAVFDGFPARLRRPRRSTTCSPNAAKKIDLVIELKVDDKILLERVEQRIKAVGRLARSDDTPKRSRRGWRSITRTRRRCSNITSDRASSCRSTAWQPIAEVTRQIGAAIDGKAGH